MIPSERFSTLCAAILLVCSSWVFVGPLHGQPSATPHDDIMRSWKARQSRIRTLRIEYQQLRTVMKGTERPADNIDGSESAKTLPASDTTRAIRHVLILDGNKLRSELHGPIWYRDVEAFVYRDSFTVVDGKNPARSLDRTLTNEDDSYTMGWVYEDNIYPSADVIDIPVLRHFRPFPPLGATNANEWSLQPERGEIDGRECLILVRRKDDTYRNECWVDPAQEFSIVRFLTVWSEHVMYQLDVEFEQDARFGSIPSNWQTTFHDIWKGQRRLRETSSYSVLSYTINEAIEQSEFGLDFPVGAMVSNRPQKELYIVKEGDEKRLVTSAERDRGATYSDLASTNSGQARLSGNSGWGWWTWTFGMGGTFILLAAIAAALYVIRWRKVR